MLACLLLPLPVAAQARLEGQVTDPTGAAVRGAQVELRSAEFTTTTRTDAEGRFAFDVPAGSGTVAVLAPGFARFQTTWSAGDAPLHVVLTPGAASEQVTVTARRMETRLSEVAESVVLLSADDMEATPALALDDVLRQVPGFTLFRRQSSRAANPTAQGVSLRGVGASGASRALVLADGVPLNDPFGGWVYWSRLPRAAVQRVEVVRGGASHLYGSDAMGGVVSVLTRAIAAPALTLETAYGNTHLGMASASAGTRFGQWGLGFLGEAFHTDGYIVVDEAERGTVDTRANSRHLTGVVTADRRFTRGSAFLRGSLFGEERGNGTPLQANRTTVRQLAGGADLHSESAGDLALRAYGGRQVYNQSFTAIAAGRDSEALTRLQRVPAQQAGFSAQWWRPLGGAHTVLAGAELRQVRGVTQEQGFFAGNLNQLLEAGGRERTVGIFAQEMFRFAPRWLLTAGLRLDHWRNYDASSEVRPVAGGTPGTATLTSFPPRAQTAVSPRLSLLHHVTPNVSLSASAYRAFRAPTLNELYRGFRVGNVVTLANQDLLAERLTGVEAGAGLTSADRRYSARAGVFWARVAQPIANVTLDVQPGLITRQRQNMGQIRSRGLEVDWNAALIPDFLDLSGGYQFAAARVRRFPANTALEGLLVPQTARHQFTAQARLRTPGGTLVALQGRAQSGQFDDDQNLLLLEPFFTLDALVSHPVRPGVELFIAAENLTGRRYQVGRTPVLTVGPPVLVRGGVRLRLGER
jgi:outer membrane receptor protein involved in Fe transport